MLPLLEKKPSLPLLQKKNLKEKKAIWQKKDSHKGDSKKTPVIKNENIHFVYSFHGQLVKLDSLKFNLLESPQYGWPTKQHCGISFKRSNKLKKPIEKTRISNPSKGSNNCAFYFLDFSQFYLKYLLKTNVSLQLKYSDKLKLNNITPSRGLDDPSILYDDLNWMVSREYDNLFFSKKDIVDKRINTSLNSDILSITKWSPLEWNLFIEEVQNKKSLLNSMEKTFESNLLLLKGNHLLESQDKSLFLKNLDQVKWGFKEQFFAYVFLQIFLGTCIKVFPKSLFFFMQCRKTSKKNCKLNEKNKTSLAETFCSHKELGKVRPLKRFKKLKNRNSFIDYRLKLSKSKTTKNQSRSFFREAYKKPSLGWLQGLLEGQKSRSFSGQLSCNTSLIYLRVYWDYLRKKSDSYHL